jgi:hypothetical protein
LLTAVSSWGGAAAIWGALPPFQARTRSPAGSAPLTMIARWLPSPRSKKLSDTTIACSCHDGVVEDEFVEQPLTGCNYSYWFDCVACGTRVNIAADLYERQTTETPSRRRADFSRCGKCDTEVDVTELRPVLHNLDDIALEDDCVARLYWYHSSPYENWPDAEAYAAAFQAQMTELAALGPFTPQELLEQHTSRAVHLGTYDA